MKKVIGLLLLVALSASRSSPIVDAPVAPMTVPCKMNNGQERPFPCEFQIVTIWLMGKNGEVVGKLTPGSTSVKLPKSKAESSSDSPGTQSFVYTAAVDFRRINTPSFQPKPSPLTTKIGFYQISTSHVDYPISPGELTKVSYVNVSPALPSPGIRPNRVSFKLQLNYAVPAGQQPFLTAPVKYLQIANPITFTKFPVSVNQYRDRAESWMAFYASVDFTK